MSKNSLKTLTRELLAEELTELGQVLDEAEGKVVPVCSKTYQKAAATAAQILRRHPKCPFILDAVAMSPALIELRSNLALEHAIQLGMCDLPAQVRACLMVGAPVRWKR